NISCCALCTWSMRLVYKFASGVPLPDGLNFLLPLFAVAVAWFFINTITLSVALSLLTNTSFVGVWREGIVLSLLNFLGSAAAAGLISTFYTNAGFSIFFLSVPIAFIIYQLHHF